MSQAHVADEWVDVHLLGTSVEVYRQLVLDLCARIATTNGGPSPVVAVRRDGDGGLAS